MHLDELAKAIDSLRSSGMNLSHIEVLLYDEATDENIIVDSIGLDGDDNFVIKFDYSG